MSLQEDKQKLEEILGAPLPEIDQIYYEGAEKLYGNYKLKPFVTPYFLSLAYKIDEMKMVLALPGSPKEVAEKTGLELTKVEESLQHLYHMGRINPGRRYFPDSNETYVANTSPINLRDNIAAAYLGNNLDWNQEKELLLITDYWCNDCTTPLPEGKGSRVIPKWNSIKNIPGVMDCENIRTIMHENFKEGTMWVGRCVCKAYRNFARFGKPNLEDGGGCDSGIKEYDEKTGHCMSFGQRGIWSSKMFNAHAPESLEEVDRILQESEDATVVYMCTSKNIRYVGNVCTCCEDCCGIIQTKNITGTGVFESRFKPVVDKDKCVGCQICLKRCPFKAISYDDNGKCLINKTKCMGCGNCVIKCPTKALKMEVVHDTDWIPDLADKL